MMNILGIHFGHDANAALIQDGRITFAISEERIARVKGWRGFPYKSIEWVLGQAGLAPSDIDKIAVVNVRAQDETLGGNLKNFYLRLGRPSPLWAQALHIPFGVLDSLMGTKFRRSIARRMLAGALRDLGFGPDQIVGVDHHLAHAAGAFFMSGYDDALVFTADGKGDGVSHRTYSAKGVQLTELAASRDFDSPGFFYASITGFLGFRKLRHEGKITGLAAFGNMANVEHVRSPLVLSGDKRRFRNSLIPDAEANNWWLGLLGYAVRHPLAFAGAICRTSSVMAEYTQTAFEAYFAKVFKDTAREDIACFAQTQLERTMTDLIRNQLPAGKPVNIAMSGGVFANVRLNQKVRELDGVKSVFIQPAMADDGLGVGAALLVHTQTGGAFVPAPVESVYFGPSYDDDEIGAALKARGLSAEYHADIETVIAEALAEKKIVGRFNKGMEWGPRALGHRSILGDPTDPAINDLLNNRLGRTEFMPFAPLIMFEHAGEWLRDWNPDHVPANFMTITYDVDPEKASRIGAVVHIDGTARPQIVKKETTPSLHKVMSTYYRRTGIPVLINTSFNMHEEPIVCSPDDAARAFEQGAVDLLAAGNWLVTKTPAVS